MWRTSYRKPIWFLSWMWLLLAVFSLPAAAERPQQQEAKEDEQTAPRFLRVRRDRDSEPAALETAVVRYVSADGRRPEVTVDLIGVVHVGDKRYYDELNRLFESYDVLLYELVAPEGAQVPQGGRRAGGGHPVGALQGGLSTLLELEFQLDCIDYTKENFVHADMSAEEFAQSMRDRGESFLQIFFRMMGYGAAAQAKDPGRSSDAQLLAALFSRDRAFHLKRILAQQFEDMEGQVAALDGPQGSTIIAGRNQKAMEVLARQIEAGKKRIGVFYGAGHMPDMERRLLDDFEMKRGDETWLEAWSLTRR